MELLSARDVDPSELRRLKRAGGVRRVARGVYEVVDPAAEDRSPSGEEARWLQQLAVKQRQAGPDAVVARSAAAALRGWDGFEPPVPVALNVSRSCRPRGPHIHRPRHIEPPTTIGSFHVTSPAQTLLELGVGLVGRRGSLNDPRPLRPDELVELALEDALRQRLTSEGELLTLLARVDCRHEGAGRLLRVLERRPFGAPPTESYLETRGVQVLRNGGLPPGRRQVELHDGRGTYLRRVDLLLGERVVVEFDGLAYHGPERDHENWSVLAAAGYRVLAFTFAQVTREPGRVVRLVADALEATAG